MFIEWALLKGKLFHNFISIWQQCLPKFPQTSILSVIVNPKKLIGQTWRYKRSMLCYLSVISSLFFTFLEPFLEKN